MSGSNSLSIRFAGPTDAAAIHRLQVLDETELSARAVLLAEVDGEAVAVLDPESGQVAANPFRRTAAIIDLMRIRADQLKGRPERRRRLRRALRPQLAAA